MWQFVALSDVLPKYALVLFPSGARQETSVMRPVTQQNLPKRGEDTWQASRDAMYGDANDCHTFLLIGTLLPYSLPQ